MPWQGGETIPPERSDETVKLTMEIVRTDLADNRLDYDRMFKIRSADIIDLNFEELLVESVINIVNNFQSCSKQVEIILLPRNGAWIENSPEGKARLYEVLKRIESETGITIRNLQDASEITPDMYSDTTHLGRYTGDIPLTHLLAEVIAPVLRNE